MLHAALCVTMRMATAPAALRLVVLFAMRDADASRYASQAGLLGLTRCVWQEAPLMRLSVLHSVNPRAALRAPSISASVGAAEPEVALYVAPVRARVPRLAQLPFVRHGRLQLRLPSRGAISNLKLEAQPDFGAPLSDLEIELEVCTRARTQHTCSKYHSEGQPPLHAHLVPILLTPTLDSHRCMRSVSTFAT